MSNDFCCPRCFGDTYLEKYRIPEQSSEEGLCPRCASRGVPLVRPEQLEEEFETLLSAYEVVDEGGESIISLLRRDWCLFPEDSLRHSDAQLLLLEVMQHDGTYLKKFRVRESDEVAPIADWGGIRDELRYKNRYFPQENVDFDALAGLLAHLANTTEAKTWCRARIQVSPEPFDLRQMGAPPREVSSHGRASPPGIPYLYLASNAETGVSEVRPHPSDYVSVAQFELKKDLKVIDFRNPRRYVSPFVLGGDIQILQLRADLPFLEEVGKELTRPVVPRSAPVDYVPSQYICEFAKMHKYDGVMYRSSAETGSNLAVFDVELAEAVKVERYSVEKVDVRIAPSNG
ncbi:RES family NAD+ phosphorylase [Marivivens donghaensis]|uniref:RES family NAD+ phosphorylase n=1 Tax=Marivivens donghaensis TaxID=1699413 RepID=A0ABX0VWK7_9RHOB|nr:RES family NAD+ phosphorylase [Marivivens donghaensis]NIY71830.1 RES family NAD+ phosphorylase [Marivivens donghaensis]